MDKQVTQTAHRIAADRLCRLSQLAQAHCRCAARGHGLRGVPPRYSPRKASRAERRALGLAALGLARLRYGAATLGPPANPPVDLRGAVP
jgi:hypothetical protein